MHTYRERLLIFPNLLLNLRLKIAENGGPKGQRSKGRITGICQVALLFQREPDS
jgi:hypothetical protein